MSSMIPLSSTPVTMSSRELAELTGKQHPHVCRDIRNMLAQIHGKQDDPNLDHQPIQGVIEDRDDRGYVAQYHLDRTHTYTLIAGYRADLRFKIIQRWQELEEQVKSPPLPASGSILLARAVQAMEAEHRERLDSHAVQLSLQGKKVAMLEQHVGTLVKAMHRTYRRNWSHTNVQQSILDLAPHAEQRDRLPSNGTHASPQIHLRRAHYRTLADGRRVGVRAHVVGKKNGSTLQ